MNKDAIVGILLLVVVIGVGYLVFDNAKEIFENPEAMDETIFENSLYYQYQWLLILYTFVCAIWILFVIQWFYEPSIPERIIFFPITMILGIIGLYLWAHKKWLLRKERKNRDE